MKNPKFLLLTLLLLLFSCGPQELEIHPTGNTYGSYTVWETRFQGCQYVKIQGAFTHKGNCDNPIHQCKCGCQ